MRTTAKLGAIAAAAALVVAVPAGAKPPHATPPNHPSHPATSHKCTPHREAYVASGTFVSWTAAPSSSGKKNHFTGTITVKVTKTNHHAAAQKGTTQTYTLNDTKVRFGKGANPPASGDRVVLIGAITTVAKKCTDQSGAGTITLRQVDIKLPKHNK